ncbi:hypothetical protein MTR67_024303 [Solanum verrucosum]|uniref:WRKY domain-containing protein n=1 Tax=Solanum verrucosum TaxID=315347 RepID=A0AAF0QYR7_SOLVR|nr:hypothetical protein MTR67_024303 [Solanum verrucosum]
MGENSFWEREVVIAELTKGKELMLLLQKHFDPMKQLVCQYLAVEILSSYDKAMTLLNGTALSGMMKSKGKEIIHPAPSSSTAPQLESPHLLADSSTKSCDRPSKYRKRKMLARRKEYVEARPGEEVPPEDGLSWRKYGQKLFLRSKHPREYYRCAHRCCGATKMVRRIETEPLSFEVTYGGSHRCGQETKNQNEELLAVQQTKCDEVAKGAAEIFESYIHKMVSTPNNSYNNSSTGVQFSNSNSVFNIPNSDFIPTPTSSPHPDTDFPLDNDSLTLLFDQDVPDNSGNDSLAAGVYKLYEENGKLSFPHRYDKQAENSRPSNNVGDQS